VASVTRLTPSGSWQRRQQQGSKTMDNNKAIVTAPPEWDKWELELVERLHTAAYAAEQIAESDKRNVAAIKHAILEMKRDLRRAESAAKKSETQFRKLFDQVWRLAKKHNVTAIRYDMQNHTSRASIG
jgi:hypothetical protein